jgi:hypothetical protein
MADEAPRTEDRGVLGNLPHTRPGRRSEKRAAGTTRPKRAAVPPEPADESGTGGPLGHLVHGAEKVAGAGLRVAGGLAREILRRLPRP